MNKDVPSKYELKSLLNKNLKLLGIVAIVMTVLANYLQNHLLVYSLVMIKNY